MIEVDPLARLQQAQRVTVLLHKPMGYVSGQAEDGYQPASVLFSAANRWAEDQVPMRFHHILTAVANGEVDALTSKYIEQLDAAAREKERELLEV